MNASQSGKRPLIAFVRVILGTAIFLAAAGAAATAIPMFTVSGRVSVNEPHSCDGGGPTGDLTQTVLLSWEACHSLKQHMDAAGSPITSNVFVATALRPLSLTVQVEVWCRYTINGVAAGDGAPVVTVRVQTNSAGGFRATVPKTACGLEMPADGITVRATAWLEYVLRDTSGLALGTVRAVWDKAKGQSVYNSVLSASQPILYSSYGLDWVIPQFYLQQTDLAFPVPQTLNLGNQTFFDGAAPEAYDYVRGALGTWQTVIALHSKLKDTLTAGGFAPLYREMFIPDLACTNCYTLSFATNGGGGGFPGGFSIDKPTPAPPWWLYAGLVSVGLPGHEFGHSMHGTIGVGSFGGGDDSMFATQSPQGTVASLHIPYVATNTLQQQEFAFALTEGFGNAMGFYFLHGCGISDRAWGDPDPLHNMWNPQHYLSCDASDSLCPYGSFRLQMAQRGIVENSPTWTARLASLSNLAQQASKAGAIMVVSNNELKIANFFCDLLDDDPDVGFAAGRIAGKTYVADYGWHVAERLDGRTPPVVFKTYLADPVPEHVTISFGQLLTALDGFVTGLHAWPPVIPVQLWRSPMIKDGANGAYNDARMSVNGLFSPQTLGMYMVNQGYLTKDQLNNILRSNRMDEVL